MVDTGGGGECRGGVCLLMGGVWCVGCVAVGRGGRLKVEGGGEGGGWSGVCGGVDVVVFMAFVAAGGVRNVGGVLVLLGGVLCC